MAGARLRSARRQRRMSARCAISEARSGHRTIERARACRWAANRVHDTTCASRAASRGALGELMVRRRPTTRGLGRRERVGVPAVGQSFSYVRSFDGGGRNGAGARPGGARLCANDVRRRRSRTRRSVGRVRSGRFRRTRTVSVSAPAGRRPLESPWRGGLPRPAGRFDFGSTQGGVALARPDFAIQLRDGWVRTLDAPCPATTALHSRRDTAS